VTALGAEFQRVHRTHVRQASTRCIDRNAARGF
jgi:hypothetical protein